MARLTVCDICGNACSNSDLIELDGWYGKKLAQKGNKHKDDRYTTERLSDREGLRADICIGCMQSHLSNITLHPVSTPKQMFERRRQEYPQESYLKSMRLTARYSVESVNCDNCQSDCYDKHLLFKATQLATDGSELTAEFCEVCVASKLMPIASFQTVAATSAEAAVAL